jgi:hypothetical protein
MTYEPRLIAPFDNSGLKKWYKPWITGITAFPQITDAYARRGVVRKREGIRILATLPAGLAVVGLKNWINPATLGDSLIAFGFIATAQVKSYLFLDGTQTFTDITFFAYPTGGAVPVTGAPFIWTNGTNDYFWAANFAGSMWVTDNLPADGIRYWNGTQGSLNVSGGWSNFQPTLTGSGTILTTALIILPYKGRLVVLNTNESGTVYSNRARWSQLGTPYGGAAAPTPIQSIVTGNPTTINSTTHGLTTGDNVSFFGFTGANANLLNGVNTVATYVTANQFTVPINTTGATIVATGAFAQLLGNPPTPFANDIFSWRSDIPGRGGFVDADTSQRIVSAEIIKDTLIVAFQRSTWRLRYTGNEILPFIWERLNTQYGAESTYSNIAFDEAALFFSRYGWIASTTNDVARIDLDIPDDSFSIEGTNVNIDGLRKVQGIRDFYRNFAYWTYVPQGQTTSTQIYGYNYVDKSWTIFMPQQGVSGDSMPLAINCFGTYRNTAGDQTWAVSTFRWDSDSADDVWSSFGAGSNEDFPYILGGDLSGNVYLMFEFFNAPTIDNTTNFNFSITTKRFNPYIEEGHKARLGYVDLYMTTLPGGEITLNLFTDDGSEPIITKTVEVFSRGVINIASITTGLPTTITTSAVHNLITGQTVQISDVVGPLGNILNNETAVVTMINSLTFTIPINTSSFTYTSGGFVYNYDLVGGDAFYTRVFLGAIGYMHQIQLTLSTSQVEDVVKGSAQFELQGIVLWTKRVGRIRNSL